MATLSGITTQEQKNEQLSRETLRTMVIDPIIDRVMKTVKAHALMGCMLCDYTIPDSIQFLTSEALIKSLKPRLPDVSIVQTGPRTIRIDWS